MRSDRAQQKRDVRNESHQPSNQKKQPPDAHAIPEVSAPDLSWRLSDHHGAEAADEMVADPWDVHIADKNNLLAETGEPSSNHDVAPVSAKVGLKLFNALNEWPPEDDADAVSTEIPLKLFNALDAWPQEDDAEAIDDNSEQFHPANNDRLPDASTNPEPLLGVFSPANDIFELDRSNEGVFDEAVDGGFEGFVADEHEDLADDSYISEFDENAQQPPWEIAPKEEERNLRRARTKAAKVVNLLDFRSPRERERIIAYLTELFQQMTHPATFRAIERASEGIGFDTLEAMVELRRWWLRFDELRTPRRSLTFRWDTARLVCLARKDYPPEAMIDDDWLDEWLRLPYPDPNYSSFSSYIEYKVLYREAELLGQGLRHWEHGNDYVEMGDDYSWYRRLPGYGETMRDIRGHFRIITPYDDWTRDTTIHLSREDEK